MDLIYTNKAREDIGVLQDFELDLAFGADENDFECSVPAASHCCEAGSLLYMEGTEYGGIVDTIESDTEAKEVKYKGRTWHGILGSKVIEPLKESDIPTRLPKGYSELNYIESTGSQYIDTRFIPDQDTKIVMDVELSDVGTTITPLCGSRPASTSDVFGIWFLPEAVYPHYGDTRYNAHPISINTVQRLFVSMGCLVASANEESVTLTDSGSFSSQYSLYLFSFNDVGTADSRMVNGKIYSCQIYDNGTLVRDFVPCRNASGVLGLYDLVNNVFYQNAGSGTFTAGADVEVEGGSGGGAVDGVTILGEDADGNSLVGKYLVISGDANDCINFILHRIGLSSLMCGFEEAAGVDIQEYQFHRFTDAYSGLTGMLASAGQKLHTEVHGGQVVLSAEAVVDYTADEEFDSDLVDFVAIKKFNAVNHLICLGAGELENRTVIHLYADNDGNISQEQTQTDMDEYAAVFEYSNAETEEELIQSGKKKLKSLWEPDKLNVDFDDTTDNYGVGDIVGAYDNITGIMVSAEIIKKIVTIKNGQITISYKVGE